MDPNDAAASLGEIAAVQRRTREAVYYAASGTYFMLWGVLAGIGYGLTFLAPKSAGLIWLCVAAVGFAAMFALILVRRARGWHGRDWRYYQALIAVMGFGALFAFLLGPWEGRQHSAFWPLLVMMGFVLGGLWMGRFFIACGLVVSVLIVAGYLAIPGSTYYLFLAAVEGGGLIAAGWWMARTGAR